MNKVLVVTGANGGVGRAVTTRFRDGGWNVFGTDIVDGEYVDFAADLTDIANCQTTIDLAVTKYGRIDGVVLAAGVWTEGPTAQTKESDFDRTFAVNVKALYFTISAALPHLKLTSGHITALSSDAGIQGNAGAAVYSASKGAVSNLIRAVAREVAPDLIRVNAICPGDIDSPMLAGQARDFGGDDPESYLSALLSAYPQGANSRFVTPDEVAGLCWYLASDEARAVTGANLSMDYGLSSGI